MELIVITSLFSALIIFMTISSLIKALIIAYKRKEISLRKSILFASISIVIGLLIVSVLPFGYQMVLEHILKF